ARTSDAAATATAATRPQGGNDDEDMRIPSGGPSGAGDCGADEAGELEVRGLLDVVARRDRMDGVAGARGAEGVDVRAGEEAVFGGDEVDRRGRGLERPARGIGVGRRGARVGRQGRHNPRHVVLPLDAAVGAGARVELDAAPRLLTRAAEAEGS